MINGSNIGTLNVKIGADYSEAEAAFNNVKKGMEEVRQQGKDISDLSDIAVLTLANAAGQAVKFLKDQMSAMVMSAVQFESAMAGVAKTTDLSKDELTAYGEEIMKMSESIPLTTTQLASISEMAGQLGISGSKNLLNFTQTMAKLGTATNMTSEQAATMLAQFANITSMDASNYDKLASSIVALGNNFATTESKITDMAQGIAAAGTNAGLSEPEILALATAASSVGIEAQAGATSWSKLIQEMQTAVETGEDLDKWAYAAHMSAGEFKQAWGKNAVEAINAFITGLKRHNDEGTSMISIMDKLGITEVRQSKLVQSLANSGDLLTRAINMSNSAWDQNNALNREAATRFQTTQSKMMMVQNRISNIQTTIGNQMLPVFNVLLDAVDSATKSFEEFAEENEWLGPVIVGVTAGLITLVVATTAATVATSKLAMAFQMLAQTMETHPVLLLISGLVALGVALFSMAAQAAQASEEMEALNDASEAAAEEAKKAGEEFANAMSSVEADAQMADILADRIDKLGKKTNRTTQEQWLLEDAIDRLNELYPELGLSIDDVNDGLSVHAQNVLEAAKAEARAKAMQDQLVKLYHDRAEAQERMRQATTLQQKAQDALSESDLDWLHRVDALKWKYGEFYEQTDEFIALAGQMPETVREMNVENMRAEETLAREKDTIAELDEQIENITTDYGVASEVTNQFESDTQGLTKAQKEQVAATDEAANQISADLQQLSVEYEAARETAMNNILEQIKGWQELHENSDVTVAGMIEGYQSQVSYMTNYTDNMRSLLDRNIDGLDEYVKAIDDGSADAAGAFAAMKDASDDELKDLVASYNERQGKIGEYSENVGKMQTDYDERMKAMVLSTTVMVNGFDQYDEAYAAASNTLYAVVDAADNMADTVSAKYKYVMQNAIQEMKAKITIGLNMNASKTSATGTVKATMLDEGGFFTKPKLAIVAEKRPEFVGAAEDLQTFINQSVNQAFNLSLPTLPEVRSGENTINVNVPIQVSKELSDSEINRKAKQISSVVSREFAMATGGRL